jgi:hypothetical protein
MIPKLDASKEKRAPRSALIGLGQCSTRPLTLSHASLI